jgi:hypothetical protein
MTTKETHLDVSGNNINSIIEIINSSPYEPDQRFADVSSNNRRFMVAAQTIIGHSDRQALEDEYDQALALLGNRMFDDSDI